MANPEHSPQYVKLSIPHEKTLYTVDDVELLLEQNESNENIIERTARREQLLELLDQIQAE